MSSAGFLVCTLLAAAGFCFAQYPNNNPALQHYNPVQTNYNPAQPYYNLGYTNDAPAYCGKVLCPLTTIECNGCQVPNGFNGLINGSRSLLWRGENLLKSIGRMFFNNISRFISGAIAIPRDFVRMVIQDGELFIRDAVYMVDWFAGSRESLEDLLNKIREQNNKAVSTPAPEDLPVFDTNLVTNSTAQLGGTAYLHCRVRNLNNRAVSWVRRRDWHILTSAMFTYTNDERFQVIHQEASDDWTLQIKYVQKRDQGAYECQVATGRGTLSHFFNLVVVVPTAYILGTGEYHIGQGSTISLVCIIENSPTPPQFVTWFHNDKMISYENAADSNSAASSSQAQIVTETGAGDKTHSRLLITDATSAHSGNYTCQASNTEPDSVYVFVSSVGDNIAAIQRQDGCCAIRPCLALLFLLVWIPKLIHW